jgi:hypothetical protein
MKNLKLYTMIGLLVFIAILFTRCDKDFDEINTSKTGFTSVDPAYMMNNAIISVTTRPHREYLGQPHTIIQWLVVPFGSSLAGANHNQWTNFQNQPFNHFYNNPIPRIQDVVHRTQDNPVRHNLHQAARIWRAYVFMQLADTYGDVPYFEAGKGFLEQIITPKYDPMETIYRDILKELDEASAALDPARPGTTGEMLYSGNVTRWKRFGYSLLLRAALRLTEVDPTTAESYAQKAIAGGLMQSNADNAKIRHTSAFQNNLGVEISSIERGNYYATKTFVESLQATNDPRLGVFCHRFVGATSFATQTAAIRTKDPALQKGMPIGYDDITISETFASEGVASLYDYSQFDWQLVYTPTTPQYHVTYGQTLLLLAEAVVRGWATGNAATIYSNAVRANMELLADYGAAAVIPSDQIEAYLANNPFDPDNAMEQIHNEFWVGSTPNGQEAWSNWRRTGFPNLAPNPYPASEIPGDFIRRHIYPTAEQITNRANLLEAIARQGIQDKMNERVWWDR